MAPISFLIESVDLHPVSTGLYTMYYKTNLECGQIGRFWLQTSEGLFSTAHQPLTMGSYLITKRGWVSEPIIKELGVWWIFLQLWMCVNFPYYNNNDDERLNTHIYMTTLSLSYVKMFNNVEDNDNIIPKCYLIKYTS